MLDDARTRRIRDDGRNALLLHAADLDVITLEPLMPYSPAGLPFYTREFYELAFSRLREGGVLCQWVPVHAMPAGLYAAFVRTFFETFPQGSLWFFEQSSALIAIKGAAGRPRDLRAPRDEASPRTSPRPGFTPPQLALSGYVASGESVLTGRSRRPTFTDRTITDLDPYPGVPPLAARAAPHDVPQGHARVPLVADVAR